jgi:hypothetical protein
VKIAVHQFRYGSFASLSSIAERSSMSAMHPIATEFCAQQRMNAMGQLRIVADADKITRAKERSEAVRRLQIAGRLGLHST